LTTPEALPRFPSVDESRDRLHRAGWSVGEVAGIGGWPERRSNGEVSPRTRRIWLVRGTNGDVCQPYCLLR
jgi:hypothetical protein